MSELGTSIIKLTVLHATPQPGEASSPKRFTKAQRAKNESRVKNSCKARGIPIFNSRILSVLNEKSLFRFINNISAKSTLMP